MLAQNKCAVMNVTHKLISFVSLDCYSYWYHRLCHKYDVPWHVHHHRDESVEKSCAIESTVSAALIYGGIKSYEAIKPAHFHNVCRVTCALYWVLVSGSHYLGHRLDYSNVFPINKIQNKHTFHHNRPNYNYSVILPFDILFCTSNLYEHADTT